MPSLHVGGAFLFFLFACRYAKPLGPLYGFLLLFIVVAAVATRWHYLIDLPVGLALAWISVWLAEKLVPVTDLTESTVRNGLTAQPPARGGAILAAPHNPRAASGRETSAGAEILSGGFSGGFETGRYEAGPTSSGRRPG